MMKTIVIVGPEGIGKTKFFMMLRGIFLKIGAMESDFQNDGADPRDFHCIMTLNEKEYFLSSMGDEIEHIETMHNEADRKECEYFITACRDTKWNSLNTKLSIDPVNVINI